MRYVLQLIQCDHKWLEGAIIRCCQHEILGEVHEDYPSLKKRAESLGWQVLDVPKNYDRQHLCPKHRG